MPPYVIFHPILENIGSASLGQPTSTGSICTIDMVEYNNNAIILLDTNDGHKRCGLIVSRRVDAL